LGWAYLKDFLRERQNMDDEEIFHNYYQILDVAGFICPAVHYGMISSVYWLNPHSSSKRLQYMGSVSDKKRTLKTKIIKEDPLFKNFNSYTKRIAWKSKYLQPHKEKKGKVVLPSTLKISDEKPFILGIDLDAFCCDKEIHNVPKEHEGVKDYEDRINHTLRILNRIRKPDLITISKSEGQEVKFRFYRPDAIDRGNYAISRQFVPNEFLDDVEKKVVRGLENIFN